MRGSGTVRNTAPLSLTFAKKPLGRRQLESVSVEATMSERDVVMREARG